MPTPAPGLNRVPRWRTMISPPVTAWPANTFTPRRWALESRPLRDEPRPFLCAIADLRDLDAGELLPVPGPALVAALGLELEHAQLLAAHVLDHLGADADPAQAVGVEHGVVGPEQDRLQLHGGAGLVGQALDEQGRTLLDAVLLAAGLDDRVHGWSSVSLRERSPPPWQRNGAVRPCGHGAEASILRHRRRRPSRPRRRRRRGPPWPTCARPPRCARGASRRRGTRRRGPTRCSRRSSRRRRRPRTCAARRWSRGPRPRPGTGWPPRARRRRSPPSRPSSVGAAAPRSPGRGSACPSPARAGAAPGSRAR